MSKTPADKSIDEQTFEALEDALKIDLDDDSLGVLDDISIEELENKVSSAARELKSAGDSRPQSAEAKSQAPGKSTAPRVPTPPFTPAAPLAPANDDSRKTTAGLLRALEIRSSRGAVRNATIISVLWAFGGLGLANLMLAPAIWQIRSVADLLAMPAAIGFLVAIIVPILIFFAFSIMMARAREMRSAARSMAEVALRLAEPENIAGDRILSVGQAVR
ncbi:MAG: kinesin, partial [Hoeflea sp.]|nr:kinesin [Hoeflea sp.]